MHRACRQDGERRSSAKWTRRSSDRGYGITTSSARDGLPSIDRACHLASWELLVSLPIAPSSCRFALSNYYTSSIRCAVRPLGTVPSAGGGRGPPWSYSPNCSTRRHGLPASYPENDTNTLSRKHTENDTTHARPASTMPTPGPCCARTAQSKTTSFNSRPPQPCGRSPSRISARRR